MEIITLRLSKECKGDRRKEAEKYIREFIIGKENPAVLVGGYEAGRDKIFHVLVLNDIKIPLQWESGRIYRSPFEEGKEKMALEYMSKHPSIFICQ